MKKQIMSIAAAAALLTTGAIAFDMQTDGTIVADITTTTKVATSYTGGVNATADLALSTGMQGNALIYPAFKSDDGWSSEISIRNTKDVAIIAKAVLYAQDDSRELLDFNLYLSPHDAVKFTISDNKVVSSDGSIAREVTDPLLGVTFDDVKFASTAEPVTINFSSSAPAGYVVIYAMTQQATATPIVTKAETDIYHLKHKDLFKDYRKTLDICREADEDGATAANWRKAFNLSPQNTHVLNGSAINTTDAFLAPNLSNACSLDATKFTGSWVRKATFTTPASDALFGEVSIAHSEDKRSLLLPATALSNYVDTNLVMLWAEGEYAAIQDRRIAGGAYIPADIKKDAATFLVAQTFFTFDKSVDATKNEATLLLTQPMKRALQMAGQGTDYWNNLNISSGNWGDFKLGRTPWTDDEGTLAPTTTSTLFGSLNSPLDGAAPAAVPGGYQAELTALSYATLTAGFEEVFKNGELAGYVDLTIGNNSKTIPAIVTQMSSTDIDGESQINWIYSVTN